MSSEPPSNSRNTSIDEIRAYTSYASLRGMIDILVIICTIGLVVFTGVFIIQGIKDGSVLAVVLGLVYGGFGYFMVVFSQFLLTLVVDIADMLAELIRR